jgi:hypothetical protein
MFRSEKTEFLSLNAWELININKYKSEINQMSTTEAVQEVPNSTENVVS